jgi:hypothetical protein
MDEQEKLSQSRQRMVDIINCQVETLRAQNRIAIKIDQVLAARDSMPEVFAHLLAVYRHLGEERFFGQWLTKSRQGEGFNAFCPANLMALGEWVELNRQLEHYLRWLKYKRKPKARLFR